VETYGGRSQEEEVKDEDRQPSRWLVASQRSGAQHLPALRIGQASSHGVPHLRLVQEPHRHRRRLILGHR
jgi:hypothetical protein